MATVIGKVSNLENIVRAVTPVTQEVRTLTLGESVFANDKIITANNASATIEFSNGEILTLGRSSQITLDDDVYSIANLDSETETAVNLDALQQAVLDGNFDALEETAAGDFGALGSASEGGLQIARIASEGKVNAGGFSTVAHAQGITDVLTHRFDNIESQNTENTLSNVLTLDEDTSLSIDVTSSASGLTGANFSILILTPPNHGTTVINADGSITYTPRANFNGQDNFSYIISDGFGGTHEASINLFVAAVNDAPVAEDDNAIADSSGAATIHVLTNDSDLDGDTLALESVVQPTNGTVSINNDGTIAYVANDHFSGQDSFTYTITDGNGGTSTAIVTVTVAPAINEAPVLTVESTKTINEDSSTAITYSATDIDGTATVTATAENGTVVVNNNGTLTYTPNENFFGSDTITVTATDNDGATTVQTSAITVNGVNDAPFIDPISSQTVVEDGTKTITFSATDTENDTLTPSVTATNGTASIDGNGDIVFVPTASFNGIATVTLSVTDGTDTTTQTFNITVTAANDAPVIDTISTQTVAEDGSKTITFTATDVDTGDTLTPSVSATNGTASIVDGDIVFVPTADFSGDATVTLTVSDGSTTTEQIFTVTVSAVNDAPTLTLDATATMDENGGTVDLNFTATDIDGTIASTTASATNGTVVVNGDGTLTFTPDADFFGDAVVTVTTTDDQGATDIQTATITVNEVAGGSNLSFSISLDSYSSDTVTAATPGSITDLGAGYGDENTVAIATNWGGGTYTTTDANETLTGGTGYTTIDSAGGDDNIIMTNANNLNIISGAGDDRVEMTGSYGGDNTITTGDGNDRIVDSSTGSRARMEIDTGAGHDSVDMAAGDDQIVNLGSGNDELLVEQGHDAIIDAGTGDDTVTFTGLGSGLNVTMGDGNDTVINASGTLDHSHSTIDTGAGDDSVQMMKGLNIEYNLGSGNDTIENLWAYTENIVRGQVIDGGTGADTLILNGNSYDYQVSDNGDGTYTVQPVHETHRYNDLTITNIEHVQYLDKTIDIGSDTSDGVFEYDMTLNAGSTVGTDTFSSITLTNVPAGVTITGATDNGDGTFTVPVDANADASITLVATSALSDTDLNSMVGTITATTDLGPEDISASLDVTVNVGVSATAPVVTMSISQATVAQGVINTSHTDLGAGYGDENTIDSMIYSTHAWDDRIVNGTDQNDTVNVVQGLRQVVSSGDGDDLIITADNENMNGLNLDTGAGSDRVVLGDSAQRSDNVINTGTGNDRVELANASDSGVWADDVTINTGAGDDYVEHSTGRRQAVDLGEGNDTYEKTTAETTNMGVIDYTETVEGGWAGDILYDGNGDRLINSANVIDGGQGIDTFIVNGSSTNYRVTARADGTYEVVETMGNAWDKGTFGVLIQNFENIQFTGDATTVDLDTFTEQNFSYDVVLHTELTDTDGSETLSDLTLGSVPAGVVVLNASGDQIHPDGSGNYIITPDGSGDVTVTLASYTPLTTDELNAISASSTATETANGLTATTTVTAPTVYDEVAISDEAGISNGNLLDNVDSGSSLDSIVYDGTTYAAADYAGGLTINTNSGGTLELDFTTGTYTSTGTGTDETFTVNATDSQSNAVSFTFETNDIAIDSDLYGDDLVTEQFNIESGHDTTIHNFDHANDVLDLSEVITDVIVDQNTLTNYLTFTLGATDTDGDGKTDVAAILIDSNGATAGGTITNVYLNNSQFDEDTLISDLNIDYQNS